MLVRTMDGRVFKLPADTGMAFHGHVIVWDWPTGVIIPHGNLASIEQIVDEGEPPTEQG